MELKKNIKAGKNSLKINLIIFAYFSLFSFAFSQSNLEGTYTDINNSNNDEVFVFNGWMFSSSPSITPFDHPVYDIWLVNCY